MVLGQEVRPWNWANRCVPILHTFYNWVKNTRCDLCCDRNYRLLSNQDWLYRDFACVLSAINDETRRIYMYCCVFLKLKTNNYRQFFHLIKWKYWHFILQLLLLIRNIMIDNLTFTSLFIYVKHETD